MVIVLNIGHALVDRAVARPWEDPEDLEARPRGLNSLIFAMWNAPRRQCAEDSPGAAVRARCEHARQRSSQASSGSGSCSFGATGAGSMSSTIVHRTDARCPCLAFSARGRYGGADPSGENAMEIEAKKIAAARRLILRLEQCESWPGTLILQSPRPPKSRHIGNLKRSRALRLL